MSPSNATFSARPGTSSVIVVDPAKHPHVKRELAQAFADWVLSPPGQETIAGYKIGGQQLFFPNAKQ